MKIILKQDIENLGRSGEVKVVRNGYARNYLIPRNLAEIATPGAIKAWQNSAERRAKKSMRCSRGREAMRKSATSV